MKKILLSLLILSSISNVHAGWADSDFTEPTIGCLGLGGAMYMMSSSSDSASKFQTFFVGCAIGGAVMYTANGYYENKVGKKYKGDMAKYKEQLKLFTDKQAVDASLGISDTHVVKYKTISGHKNPDGTITTPHIEIGIDQPGLDMVLGE